MRHRLVFIFFMEKFDLRNKKILVTGGNGFLGKWVVKALRKKGAIKIFAPSSKEYNFINKLACEKAVKNQDVVIHLAAKVGGIGFNRDFPGEMLYDNTMMGVQLIDAARKAKVKKMLIVGTVCAYPKYCPVPFSEEDLWSGYPDEITGIYGLAKKILLVQSQAYRKQYDFNSIFLIPTNLYGPDDNFDVTYGHVVPSLIEKIIKAHKSHQDLIVWGTGKATREFLYVEDMARAIIQALEYYNSSEPVNIGTGRETAIMDIVGILAKIIGFQGKIIWDTTKPDVQKYVSYS